MHGTFQLCFPLADSDIVPIMQFLFPTQCENLSLSFYLTNKSTSSKHLISIILYSFIDFIQFLLHFMTDWSREDPVAILHTHSYCSRGNCMCVCVCVCVISYPLKQSHLLQKTVFCQYFLQPVAMGDLSSLLATHKHLLSFNITDISQLY